VTATPAAPLDGETPEMLGEAPTQKDLPLLATLLTVTATLPVLAPLGTVTLMKLALQVEAVPALTPLKATVLPPWLAPRLLPVMVTTVPTSPDVGHKLEMVGGVVTAKDMPLLATPFTVTTTFPVLAPLGTTAVTLVVLQLAAMPALTPLKVTALLPWLAPKLLPVMVTAVPTGPEVGDRLEIVGVGVVM
jgi:hypothetical protein